MQNVITRLFFVLFIVSLGLPAQERKVEATWLYRDVAKLREQTVDLASASCKYTPIFGEGDAQPEVPKSVLRFGKLTVEPHGTCKLVEYAREEELYFVLDGNGVLHYGEETHPLMPNDFTYLPPAMRHGVSNASDQPLHLVLTTVRIPTEITIEKAPKLEVANLTELKEQTVEGHPQSVQYKLLIGPRGTKRDRISTAYNITDLFLMDFQPGGTNFPHHHENAEEIYLVLDGEGQMAAGGGMNGVEGLHPAKAGDAYYFRQNCTVGFYNQKSTASKAHILAVRVFVPIPKSRD